MSNTSDYISAREFSARLPIPPEIVDVEIKGDDPSRSFRVSADDPPIHQDAIYSFYTDYFAKNGWKNALEGHDEIEGLECMLLYVKGKEEINVIASAANDRLHFVAFYKKHDHTHEEFEALIKSTASRDALELVDAVKKVYIQLRSYRDIGCLEVKSKSRPPESAQFDTAYIKPNYLRWNFADNQENGHPCSHALRVNEDNVLVMSHYDEEPKSCESAELAIAAMFGVSSMTSGIVPALLIGDDNLMSRLAHLKLLENDISSEGHEYVRLEGVDYSRRTNTLWIDASTFLIRKVESYWDSSGISVITYQPEANVEIKPEELEFITPKR